MIISIIIITVIVIVIVIVQELKENAFYIILSALTLIDLRIVILGSLKTKTIF